MHNGRWYIVSCLEPFCRNHFAEESTISARLRRAIHRPFHYSSTRFVYPSLASFFSIAAGSELSAPWKYLFRCTERKRSYSANKEATNTTFKLLPCCDRIVTGTYCSSCTAGSRIDRESDPRGIPRSWRSSLCPSTPRT